MNDETIVAVFDTAEHASAAVRDLESAGVPSGSITQHAGTGSVTSGTMGQPRQEQGFWASLFGGEPEHGHDTAVYDRSLQGGSTVVTVRGSGAHLDQVLDILERHNPIDIDERAASYGVAQTGATSGLTQTGVASGQVSSGVSGSAATSGAGMAANAGVTDEPGTIQLSEETLAVGKRAVNRGTTRVRRYVVETPVEESVNLRDERVTIERRPVTDGRAVGGSDFSDKTIELTETAEEAVVSKQARVKEEVVIRKDVSDRTETVRDTVRREDVEITKEPGATTGSMATGTTGTTSSTTGTVGTGGTTSPYKPAGF